MIRAIERVALACQALRAAASDLAVESGHNEAARELEQAVEHVCELAEQLERRAWRFRRPAGTRG